MHKLIIGVYGCDTDNKYKNQILKIEETWGLVAKENNIPLLFLLGEDKILTGDQYIHLDGVKNDYLSASFKQNLGIKYIHDNFEYKYLFLCGSDTFICINNLLDLLCLIDKDINKDKGLYIGGHGCYRDIDKRYYFHSGGPGIILNNIANNILYHKLKNMVKDWKEVCENNNVEYLIPSCDVCIAYYIHNNNKNIKGSNINNIEVVKTNNLFFNCNYKGFDIDGEDCCSSIINDHIDNIVSCHSMTLEDFDRFNNIKIKNKNKV